METIYLFSAVPMAPVGYDAKRIDDDDIMKILAAENVDLLLAKEENVTQSM